VARHCGICAIDYTIISAKLYAPSSSACISDANSRRAGLTDPLISDDGESATERRAFRDGLAEARHQRGQSALRHGRDEFVEHAALAKQRVGAGFGCVGLEQPIHSQAFASGT